MGAVIEWELSVPTKDAYTLPWQLASGPHLTTVYVDVPGVFLSGDEWSKMVKKNSQTKSSSRKRFRWVEDGLEVLSVDVYLHQHKDKGPHLIVNALRRSPATFASGLKYIENTGTRRFGNAS